MSEFFWEIGYQMSEKDNISLLKERKNWNEKASLIKFQKELSGEILQNIKEVWDKKLDDLRKNLALLLAATATDKLSWFSAKVKLPISPKIPWEIIRFPDWAKYNPSKWTIDDFLKIVYQEVDSAVWNVKPSKFLKFWAKSLGTALWVLVELIFPTPFNEITWEEFERLQKILEELKKELEIQIWIRKYKKTKEGNSDKFDWELEKIDSLKKQLKRIKAKIITKVQNIDIREKTHEENWELNISIKDLKNLIEERIINRKYDDLKDKMDLDIIIKYQKIINEVLWDYDITDKKYFLDEWVNGVILQIEDEKVVLKLPKRIWNKKFLEERKIQDKFIEKLNNWQDVKIDEIREQLSEWKIEQNEFEQLNLFIYSINIPSTMDAENIFIMEKIYAKSIKFLNIKRKIQTKFPNTIKQLWIELDTFTTWNLESLWNMINNHSKDWIKEEWISNIPSISKIQLDLLEDFLKYINSNWYYHKDLDSNDRNILLNNPDKNGISKIYIIDFWISIVPWTNSEIEENDWDEVRDMLKNFIN